MTGNPRHGRSRPRRTGARGERRAPARGPLVFGAVVFVAMVLVAAWAIRGLLQSEPPAVPTPSNSAASGSPLPVVTATVPSVEATATGVASVEPPTPPSSPTPTPTPPPPVVVGAFGELPAPNLPQPAYPPGQLTLQYELGLDLAALPTEAPVYRLTPRQWDDASVSALARSLGLEGPVERTPGGGFLVRSSHGQLVVSDLTIQFQAATPTPTPSPAGDTTATPEATAPPLPLPSDGELLTVARSWLERNRLVTTPLDGGRVRERLPEMGMAIVTFGPAEPEPVLSAVPSATLTVTAEGTIRQAFVAWPAALEPSVYSLRPAETLWTDVQNGRGTLEVDETIFTRASLPLRGTARITSAQLAWVDAGQGSTRYLTPVVRFQGTALFEGYSEPVELSVTVAAVAAQIAPRG